MDPLERWRTNDDGTTDMEEWADGFARRVTSTAGQRHLLALGAVTFAVEMLVLTSVPPAEGFENSITNAYPAVFWAAFAVGITAAILVFVSTVLSYSRNWWYAFVLLACNYGVFFFLPVHRGYALYDRGSADALGHLGIVKSILQSNALPDTFYPVEHLLISNLGMQGISLPVARYLTEFAFTLLFIGSVGILVRELVGDRRGLPAGLAAATPLVFMNFQVRIHPAILSIMLFPLILFLLVRARSHDLTRYRLGYVTLSLTVAFFHPVTIVFLVILILSTAVCGYIYSKVTDWDSFAVEYGPVTSRRTKLAGFLIVVSVAWYSAFYRTSRAIQEVFAGSGGDATIVGAQTQMIRQAGLDPTTLAARFVQKYGALAIYIGIAALFGLFLLRQIRHRRVRTTDAYLAFQLVIGVGLSVLFFAVYLIESDPIRVSRYLTVIAVLAVGVGLIRTTNSRRKTRRLGTAALTVAIVLAAVISTFAGTTYWSNQHMTHAEYEGAEFVLTYHDTDEAVRTASLTTKTQWYVTGSRKEPNELPVFRPGTPGFGLPRHLGYADSDSASQTFDGGTYIVTHQYDLERDEAQYFAPEQRQALSVYDDSDVRELDRDPTVQKVYTNDGFALWKVTDEEE